MKISFAVLAVCLSLYGFMGPRPAAAASMEFNMGAIAYITGKFCGETTKAHAIYQALKENKKFYSGYWHYHGADIVRGVKCNKMMEETNMIYDSLDIIQQDLLEN